MIKFEKQDQELEWTGSGEVAGAFNTCVNALRKFLRSLGLREGSFWALLDDVTFSYGNSSFRGCIERVMASSCWWCDMCRWPCDGKALTTFLFFFFFPSFFPLSSLQDLCWSVKKINIFFYFVFILNLILIVFIVIFYFRSFLNLSFFFLNFIVWY